MRHFNIAAMLGVLLLTATAAKAQDAAAGSATHEPATHGLGSRPAEVLLAKFTVSDLPRSYEFYTRVIGLKPASHAGVVPAPPTHEDEAQKAFIEVPLNFSGSLADPIFVLVHQRGLSPTPGSARLSWVGFKVPDLRALVSGRVPRGPKWCANRRRWRAAMSWSPSFAIPTATRSSFCSQSGADRLSTIRPTVEEWTSPVPPNRSRVDSAAHDPSSGAIAGRLRIAGIMGTGDRHVRH